MCGRRPLLFQHLSVRDILQLSQVSIFCEQAIGDSKECMKKVWLRFYPPLNDVGSLVESRRKYQNFKVQRTMPEACEQVFKMHQWRGAMVRDDITMDINLLTTLLEHLATTTVEQLDIWDVAIAESSKEVAPIDFPCLRKLEYNLSTPKTFAVFLGKNPRLREVKLSSNSSHFSDPIDEFIEPENIIDKFFEKNPQIENLELKSITGMFRIKSKASLRVKRLSFEGDLTNGEEENFIKFIENQICLRDILIQGSNNSRTLDELTNALRSCNALTIKML